MHYKFVRIALILILLFNKQILKGSNDNPKINKKLKQVYTLEINPNDKRILKLYEDFTYEFLNFKLVKKRKFSYRESGTYNIENNIIYLNIGKYSEPLNHSSSFIIIEKSGLKSRKKNIFSKSKEEFFQIDSSLIYFGHSYTDPVFGTIYNNYNSKNKLIADALQKSIDYESPETFEIEKENNNERKKNDYLRCKNYSNLKPLNKENIKKLKVVLLVGNVSELTESFISSRREIASYLKSIGAQVIEIYPPNNWKDFTRLAKGAHIFIYAGHGSLAGDNSTGGICLDDGIASSNDVRRDLKLHKNALVMFNHACGGAGSSALDVGDIGISEAASRVINYSRPFFDIGAGAYFANNFQGTAVEIVKEFISGMTLEQIYVNHAKLWETIDLRIPNSKNMNEEIAISSFKYLDGHKAYSHAFAGNPCFTIWDIFNN